MTRRLTDYNIEPPMCVVRMSAKPPACFQSQELWLLYLVEAYRGNIDEPAERRAMDRGEHPPYCSDCTVGYRAKMQAQGRCHPPDGAVIPEPKVLVRVDG